MALCTQPRCSWGSSFFFPDHCQHIDSECVWTSPTDSWGSLPVNGQSSTFWPVKDWAQRKQDFVNCVMKHIQVLYPFPCHLQKQIYFLGISLFLLTVLYYGNIITMYAARTAAETIRVKAENSTQLRGHGSPFCTTYAWKTSLERLPLEGKQDLFHASKLVLYIWSTHLL